MTFANEYTHRRVAEGAARGCDVCFKPTTSVLTTAENRDFFFLCASHLDNRDYCTPVVDKAAEAARLKKAADEREKRVQEEMARLKKEYEERKKKEGKKKEGDKEDEDKKDDKDEDKKDDKDKDTEKKDKDTADKPDKTDAEPAPGPRVYALQKFIYQQRLDKRRQADAAKRNRERLATPGFFPSVPKGDLK